MTRRFELQAAIHRCCDARGDTEANRTGLLAECAVVGERDQADLIEHFTAEAIRWEIATGQRPREDDGDTRNQSIHRSHRHAAAA